MTDETSGHQFELNEKTSEQLMRVAAERGTSPEAFLEKLLTDYIDGKNLGQSD